MSSGVSYVTIIHTAHDGLFAGRGLSTKRWAVQRTRGGDDAFPSSPARSSSVLCCLVAGLQGRSPVATVQTEC